MKKVLHLISLLILGGGILGCSGDDDSTNNQITDGVVVNNGRYTINKGVGIEKGMSDSTNTHYAYDFILSDGQINIIQSPTLIGFTLDNASIIVFLLMNSFGNDFQTGVYNFDQGLDQYFSFFNVLQVRIDNNGDADFIDAEDVILDATAGTVTVSGTLPNYVLDIDVTLSNGENLTFTYSDSLTYVNNLNKAYL